MPGIHIEMIIKYWYSPNSKQQSSAVSDMTAEVGGGWADQTPPVSFTGGQVVYVSTVPAAHNWGGSC